jgi:hypothetical protein
MFGHENKKTIPTWGFMQLRIKKSHLSIGCGGQNDAALPYIQHLVDQINEIALKTKYLEEPCRLDTDGGYLNIMNMTGFTTQAGWMFVGMLLKDGWYISSYHTEKFTNYHNGKEETRIEPMIIMQKGDGVTPINGSVFPY